MKTLDSILEATDGKFVSVSFIKKDGTLRKLVGRLGVVKHLKGGQCTLNRKQYVIIYDVQNEGYRAVNRDTIQSVTVDGIVHTVNT